MEFNIINTWELIYKRIIFIFILLISILSICWYFKSVDTQKSDTAYIVSILYALFLFLIGIYDSYMKNKIDEKFYERRNYYLNLLKIKDLFNTINFENYSDEEVFEAIIWFKGFTSRADGMQNVQPYILQQGFKFDDEELTIEDEFIVSRQKLIEKLNNGIMQYIDKNSISKKCPYPKLDKVYFSVEEWCIKYTNLNGRGLKNMEDHIYRLFLESQKELDEFEIIMQKVLETYKSYKKKVEWNTKTIENTYGPKLKYEFLQEDRLVNEIKSIRILIEGIQMNMCSNGDLSEFISEVKGDIQSVYERVLLFENNLGDEIHIIKDEIIDNLKDEK